MKSFFKIFFASTAALFFFSILVIVIGVCTANSGAVTLSDQSVLTIDLSKTFPEVGQENPLLAFQSENEYNLPPLYEVLHMIEKAIEDPAVKALYIKGGYNMNGFGNSDELRNAILQFKEKSQKPVYAYANDISQQSYYVMSAADSIFLNPQGSLEWTGLSAQLFFFKGLTDKLDINMQVVYAGKFKSATEPFRENKMSEPNKVQYKELLEDIFGHYVSKVSASRNIDSALLRKYADEGQIVFASDAYTQKLVDGLLYEDQIEDRFKALLGITGRRKVAYESISKYAEVKKASVLGASSDKIAIISAEGNIVTGKGGYGMIGGEEYISLIRKARTNSVVKAVVFRINSGGGSSLASEEIWREIELTRAVKPVIVSMGDYAASGGYYIAAGANTIVADPTTLTGSIGVFSLIPSVEGLLKKKMGINIDGVATSENAKPANIFENLSPHQLKIMKAKIDTIYHVFKQRVADGRNLSMDYVDSIAQGRVWSGIQAKSIGLVDTLGGISTAIQIAAKTAGLADYGYIIYPSKKNILDLSGIPFGASVFQSKEKWMTETLGHEAVKFYQTIQNLENNVHTPLLMPYETFLFK